MGIRLRDIGERIETILRKTGMTRSDLGARLGVKEGAVGKYIRGASDPGAAALAKIAEIGGVSIDYLITGKGSAPLPEVGKGLSEEDKQAIQTAQAVLKVAHLETRFHVSDVSTGNDYGPMPEAQQPDPDVKELMRIYHQLSKEDRLQLIKTGKGWLAVNESRKDVGGGPDCVERNSA